MARITGTINGSGITGAMNGGGMAGTLSLHTVVKTVEVEVTEMDDDRVHEIIDRVFKEA